jgi:hypothetical protein
VTGASKGIGAGGRRIEVHPDFDTNTFGTSVITRVTTGDRQAKPQSVWQPVAVAAPVFLDEVCWPR